MEKILICGDSFSCDNPNSWCDLLSQDYNLTNRSQAGVSEYRVWLQWTTADLADHDAAIVCHTSGNRIYSPNNFFHDLSGIHKNCDLIYQDVKARTGQYPADHVIWWFENIFDLDHADFYHRLLLDHWMNLPTKIPVVHVSFFDYDVPGLHCFHDVWQANKGPVNHMDLAGNREVYARVNSLLNSLQKNCYGRHQP